MYVVLLVNVVFSGGRVVLLRATHEACKIQTTPNVCREDRETCKHRIRERNGAGWTMMETYAKDKEILKIVLEPLRCQDRR